MFAIKIRQLYFVSNKIICRNYRNRGKRLNTSGPNPGLDKRIKAFKNDGFTFQEEDVEDFVEQSESNFHSVDEAYYEHQNETLIGKHDVRRQIVKEKYFKEHMPNLLTWSEKEQIRHLANTQPDEWTPQKLAESFPITEIVVKKLLKYPWKPTTEQRIARHDASAMRNWRQLKEGTLDIPKELHEHFMKFSNRTIPPLTKNSIKIDLSQMEKIGEFENIIKRCAYSANKKPVEKDNHEETNEEHPKQLRKDFKKITLDELATKIQGRLDKGKNIETTDKIIIDTIDLSSKESTPTPVTDIDIVENIEVKSNLTEFKERDTKVLFVGMQYPERIRIPKNAYKRSATYKINDCFYDHDGRFLYRVIGMSENSP